MYLTHNLEESGVGSNAKAKTAGIDGKLGNPARVCETAIPAHFKA